MTAVLPTGWREDVKTAEQVRDALIAKRDAAIPKKVWETPGDLARAVEPGTVQTAALDIIDQTIIDAYNTPDARIIISMPPQEGKSQRTTRTGSLWALTRNPELRVVIMSYAVDLALEFSRDIRNWISTNDGTDGTLDLRLRIAKDNGSAKQWRLAGHKGGVRAVGLDSGLTGHPADALIIDDPIANKQQADSPAHRKAVWDWYRTVAGTRLAPGAPVIVIMTRWHEDDLAGKLLAQQKQDEKDGAESYDKWTVINIPAQADYDPTKGETDLLGRAPGEWMVSARGDRNWPKIKRRTGSRDFQAMFQGNPTPETGNVWSREWWSTIRGRMWSRTQDGRSWKVTGVDEVIMSWDMAFKDTKSSDFVVGQVWAKSGADTFLLDQVRARMSFTETLKAFEDLVALWPQAGVKLVEDKANGTAVIDSLKQKIPGIVAINPTESKYARASAVAPFVEAGNVHLPDPLIALFPVADFLEEASAFPNATHDDQVDAASQALARFYVDGSGFQDWLDALEAENAERDGVIAAAEAEVADQIANAVDPIEAQRIADFKAQFRDYD